jgi:glycosyltransferase involved in cell wall biosynthesis
MKIGIDASNIRAGGGVTHLVELLKLAEPEQFGFTEVIVWSCASTLRQIEDRPWLVKSHQSLLDEPLPKRIFWQKCRLDDCARQANCDLLFIPGGSYSGRFGRVVTMSQNLLPFDWPEIRRYGLSSRLLRFLILRWTQGQAFCKADGVIFLTDFARKAILRQLPPLRGKTATVAHGINPEFFCPPRIQHDIGKYSTDNPFRLLYVSRIDAYKHQWAVAKATAILRAKGWPVQVDLIGSDYYQPAVKQLRAVMETEDPTASFIRHHGSMPYAKLPEFYHQADLAVFASSCENLPNILLESMAAGLPIACADRGPMPEVLQEAGIYFDPEDPEQMALAIEQLILDPELRGRLAAQSFEAAKSFTWEHCAAQTFSFFAQIATPRVNAAEVSQLLEV